MADPGTVQSQLPMGADWVARAITDIQRDIRELGPSIARSFGTTIQTLTAQQATLTDQVAQIASVVSKQVVPDVGHSAASRYSLGTSAQELCRITFTVPAGYTRAQVLGTTTFSVYNASSTSADILRGYVDVNGTYSTPSPSMVDTLRTGQITNSRSVILTGLTGGATYYVRAIGYTQLGVTGAGASGNVCNLDAQVIYLQ
jgi:hypothetical protein